MDEIIYKDNQAYVPKSYYDDVWGMYVTDLQELIDLRKEMENIQKELTRLKRLERRAQERWRRDNEPKR